jgi:putative PIN family toxin of toxin-antitoxin system
VIVVLDSGIWISAMHFGGTPLRALERALAVDQLAYCDEIRTEVIRVLTDKLGWEKTRATTSLRLYLRGALRTMVKGELHGVCRDPNDDMVFECAVTARARVIVSGDKDLLTVKDYRNIRILSARQYVDLNEN